MGQIDSENGGVNNWNRKLSNYKSIIKGINILARDHGTWQIILKLKKILKKKL